MQTDHSDVRAAMREVNRIFEEEVCAGGRFAALERVYTRDAIILPPGQQSVSGIEGIIGFWADTCRSLKVRSCSLRPYEVAVAGDTAYEVANGEVGTENGPVPLKYVVIWKKEGGSWKWHRDIWNLNS